MTSDAARTVTWTVRLIRSVPAVGLAAAVLLGAVAAAEGRSPDRPNRGEVGAPPGSASAARSRAPSGTDLELGLGAGLGLDDSIAPAPSPGSGEAPGSTGSNSDLPAATIDLAVVGPLLDALRTGAEAGPGLTFGVVSGLVGVALGPISELPGGAEVSSFVPQLLAQLQAPIPEFRAFLLDSIEQLRVLTRSAAGLNPALDEALASSADNLDLIVERYGDQIQPFDTTLAFLASLLRAQQSG